MNRLIRVLSKVRVRTGVATILTVVPSFPLSAHAGDAAPGPAAGNGEGTSKNEIVVGPSADLALPVHFEEGTARKAGGSVDVIAGYRVGLGAIALRTELALGYVGMAVTVARARAGVRLEGTGFVHPYVFARAGVADVHYDTSASVGAPAVDLHVRSSRRGSALTYDGGLGLTLETGGVLELDAHASYNGLAARSDEDAPAPTASWVSIGLGVAARF